MKNTKDTKEKWKTLLHSFLYISNYVMVVFYLIFSLILLFTSIFSATLSPFQRKSVGGILLVYAMFRAYRIYRVNKESKNENDQEDEDES